MGGFFHVELRERYATRVPPPSDEETLVSIILAAMLDGIPSLLSSNVSKQLGNLAAIAKFCSDKNKWAVAVQLVLQ